LPSIEMTEALMMRPSSTKCGEASSDSIRLGLRDEVLVVLCSNTLVSSKPCRNISALLRQSMFLGR
jgi:hypothetical protein